MKNLGRARLTAGAAVFFLAFSTAGAASAEDTVPKNWQIDHSEFSESIKGIEHLVITNTLGTVRLKAGAENVDAQMLAQFATADERTITPEIRREDSTLHLDIVLKGEEPAEEPELWQRRHVDLAVAIPSGLAVSVTTTDGEIETKGLDAPVSAKTERGSIMIRGSHAIKAVSAHGTVRVITRDRERGGPMHLESVNGDLRLDLLETTPGTITVATRGPITTDFSIDIKTPVGATHKTGRVELGGEGPKVHLESANGTIRLSRIIDLERTE